MIKERKPLISVIITNHNYAEFIGESIESVLGQTYRNLEIIVIDDGSNDNSDTTIKNIVRDNKSIHYLTQKNKGVVHARNRGLEVSKGDYVIFIDADDTIPATFIEGMYNTAVERDVDVVYCDLKMFGEIEGVLTVGGQGIDNLKSFSPTPICQLIRKNVIGSVTFDPALNELAHEDNDFFFALYANGAKFIKSTELYNYRIHTSGRNPGGNHRKHYEAMIYIYQKYSKQYPHIMTAIIDLLEKKDEEVDLWHKVADERLALINDKDNLIRLKDKQILDIIKSKRYKVSKVIVSPISTIESILKREKHS